VSYVACALTGMVNDRTTWCGRRNVSEWAFTDASHAALNGLQKGRLVLCGRCRKAIISALNHG